MLRLFSTLCTEFSAGLLWRFWVSGLTALWIWLLEPNVGASSPGTSSPCSRTTSPFWSCATSVCSPAIPPTPACSWGTLLVWLYWCIVKSILFQHLDWLTINVTPRPSHSPFDSVLLAKFYFSWKLQLGGLVLQRNKFNRLFKLRIALLVFSFSPIC